MLSRVRTHDGAAAVEFALILPILVLLVIGLVEFGRGYNAKISLQHAAREGVRVHALQTGEDPEAVTKAAAPSLDPSLIGVTFSVCNPGGATELTATYPFSYTIPLFGEGTLDLIAKGVMRCGG